MQESLHGVDFIFMHKALAQKKLAVITTANFKNKLLKN
jgi:hypothetical protein